MAITIGGGEREVTGSGCNKMQSFCDKNLRDFPNCESKVVSGIPGEEMVSFADEQGTDLVIMGTHGRKGIDRIVMGSVADRVVKSASMPVLTVNPSKPKVRYVTYWKPGS